MQLRSLHCTECADSSAAVAWTAVPLSRGRQPSLVSTRRFGVAAAMPSAMAVSLTSALTGQRVGIATNNMQQAAHHVQHAAQHTTCSSMQPTTASTTRDLVGCEYCGVDAPACRIPPTPARSCTVSSEQPIIVAAMLCSGAAMCCRCTDVLHCSGIESSTGGLPEWLDSHGCVTASADRPHQSCPLYAVATCGTSDAQLPRQLCNARIPHIYRRVSPRRASGCNSATLGAAWVRRPSARWPIPQCAFTLPLVASTRH